MSRIVYFFQQSWLLIVASLGFGLVLAAAEGALGPRIAAWETAAADLRHDLEVIDTPS